MHQAVALSLLLLLIADAPTTRPLRQYDHGGIVRGDIAQKTLSLIFTGGDYAEGIPTILEVCKAREVPAHFFVTGDFLRLHPEAVSSIVAAGHVVGPHSDTHLLYCDWSDRAKTLVTREAFLADLQTNLDDLKAMGVPPTPYFVPPFEWYNQEQVDWARELGLTLINYTPGSGSNRDYLPESEPKFVSSQKIKDDILKFEEASPHGLNGFILLLHAGSKRKDKMHDQLDALVNELNSRGYRFVSLKELIGG